MLVNEAGDAMEKIHVYQIWFPTSNKCYVGQTNNLKKRMSEHLDSKYLVGNALRKYNDWIISILHTVKSRDEANRIEIEEIRNFNSIRPNGYNLTRGGDGGNTFTNNPNKEKIRCKYIQSRQGKNNSFYGKRHSEETIKKNRQAHIGVRKSDESIQKRTDTRHKNGWNGRSFSEEQKQNKSEEMQGNKIALGCHHSAESILRSRITTLKNKIVKLEKN